MIVSAALRLEMGVIVSLPKPARHHTILHAFGRYLTREEHVQGFLTAQGHFMNRKDAYQWAYVCGQLGEGLPVPDKELFSEDLW